MKVDKWMLMRDSFVFHRSSVLFERRSRYVFFPWFFEDR